MRVVATAGHVDHGKSSLVLALTGTDPDRFAEEKRRGLTIDLGFAHTTLPSGAGVSFVDVPGHVRFLRNMLAGVGGVDACLFVVAATEGWKPQSEEHLRILSVLGLRHGVIALTKADLVDEEWLEIALLEIADRVEGTFLGRAPIVPVAAPSGVGLDALRAALDDLVVSTPASADRGRPRLWIDRAFAARGSGTVVTGTLTGGGLARDDAVVIEPGARTARVRSIQTLGTTVDTIGPGNRVALNLAGVGHDELGRGDAVEPPVDGVRSEVERREMERFAADLDGFVEGTEAERAQRVEEGSGVPDAEVEPAQVWAQAEVVTFDVEQRRGLYAAVNVKGGTAFASRDKDIVVAGKTGTAQVGKLYRNVTESGYNTDYDHAWFAGYAPAEDPQIAFVVLVEHGGHGGRASAPVAMEIIRGYFHKAPLMPPADDDDAADVAQPDEPAAGEGSPR